MHTFLGHRKVEVVVQALGGDHLGAWAPARDGRPDTIYLSGALVPGSRSWTETIDHELIHIYCHYTGLQLDHKHVFGLSMLLNHGRDLLDD
jgi:hypothetical protein